LRRHDPVASFWAHVEVGEPGACWLWRGGRFKNGYGRFNAGRQWHAAHRFSYALHNGPLVDGLEIAHLCHDRQCVNPAHLMQTTRAINAQQSVDAERYVRGTQTVHARMTDDGVREMRSLYAAGWRQVDLAARFGIIQATVSKIIRRDTWKHVE
jgi:hypothetical protein